MQIQLRSYQEQAVHEAERSLRDHHGILIADDVGLGKTVEAIAIAARLALPVLVVCPASLAEMWRASTAEHLEQPARVVSLAMMSRRPQLLDEPHLVIVDEAHAFGNPSTRRYRNLALLTLAHKTVLLTATPIRNRSSELLALLHLFCPQARAPADEASRQALLLRLTPHVMVARSRDDVALVERPLVRTRHVASAEAWSRWGRTIREMTTLLTLPGEPGELIELTLTRRLLSSVAAFRTSAARLLRYLETLADAAEHGHGLGRQSFHRDFERWLDSPHPQTVLPLYYLQDAETAPAPEPGQLRERIARARAILADVSEGGSADQLDVALRLATRGARALVFTQYVHTARAMYARAPANATLWTSSELCHRTLGPVSAERALRAWREDELAVIIASDVASQGLGFDEAATVVHLDVPWNPARLRQREGRAQRGGNASPLAVHMLVPPDEIEQRLHLLEGLSRKRSLHERFVLAHRYGPVGDLPPVAARGLPPVGLLELMDLYQQANQLPCGFEVALGRLQRDEDGDPSTPWFRTLLRLTGDLRPEALPPSLVRRYAGGRDAQR